jgi:hypothetical protein
VSLEGEFAEQRAGQSISELHKQAVPLIELASPLLPIVHVLARRFMGTPANDAHRLARQQADRLADCGQLVTRTLADALTHQSDVTPVIAVALRLRERRHQRRLQIRQPLHQQVPAGAVLRRRL